MNVSSSLQNPKLDATNPICDNLVRMAILLRQQTSISSCCDKDESGSCSSSSHLSSGYCTASPGLLSTPPQSPPENNVFNFEIPSNQMEEFELQEMARDLLEKPKRPVPYHGYVCHICFVANDHVIQECPKKVLQHDDDKLLTPYQGSKQCYGEYMCPKCKRKWRSTKSESQIGQCCTKCRILTFPAKQMSLAVAESKGLISSQPGGLTWAMSHWDGSTGPTTSASILSSPARNISRAASIRFPSGTSSRACSMLPSSTGESPSWPVVDQWIA